MNQPTARASKDILVALVLLLLWPVASTLLADANFVPARAVAHKTGLKTIELLCAPSVAIAKSGTPAVQATSSRHSPVRDHPQQASPAN